jgi:hypothetical protein
LCKKIIDAFVSYMEEDIDGETRTPGETTFPSANGLGKRIGPSLQTDAMCLGQQIAEGIVQ